MVMQREESGRERLQGLRSMFLHLQGIDGLLQRTMHPCSRQRHHCRGYALCNPRYHSSTAKWSESPGSYADNIRGHFVQEKTTGSGCRFAEAVDKACASTVIASACKKACPAE